jgi:4'-phosphopantetheinyl transferase
MTTLLRRQLTSKRKTLFIHGDLLYLVRTDRALIFRIRRLHGAPRCTSAFARSCRMTGVRAKLGPCLALGKRDVHLWHLDLDDRRIGERERECASLFSADETERPARVRFARDRRHLNLCRGTLCMLLASYLEEEPSHLIFSCSANGKHELRGIHESCGLRLNVSHSGDMAFVGVTFERRSGVDIEAIRYDVEIKATAQRFFSVSEQRDSASSRADDQHRSFSNCSARKEAYVTALGSGLSLPLSEFDVSLRPANRAVFWPRVRIRSRRSVGPCWSSARTMPQRWWPRTAGMELTCRELTSGFGSGDADANS